MAVRDRLGTLLARATKWRLPEVTIRLPHIETDSETSATDSSSKRLLLTFDDGPTDRGTGELLDVLAEFDVRAMFFLCGSAAETHPVRVAEIMEAGHGIGHHSHSHPDAWKAPETELIADYKRGTATLEDLTGMPMRWMRPPFGKLSKPLVRWSRSVGQKIMLWDVMPGDFDPAADANRIAKRIAKRTGDRSILCLHDNTVSQTMTPNALRQVLPKLRDGGFDLTARDGFSNADQPPNHSADAA